MDHFKVAATERSPELDFDYQSNVYWIRGESYPEDVAAFYGPALATLHGHLQSLQDATVEFNFELIYFNSSSAKIIMEIFEALDEVAEQGNSVAVNWFHDEDDDNMAELGEEFGEDLITADFKLVRQSG